MKNPLTPAGIEPATFRFVAQHLGRCATAVPRGMGLLFLTSALDGGGWLRPLYPRERDPVHIVQEAQWASGSVWTAAEILAPTGIRSPDRPACSELLYRQDYPGPAFDVGIIWRLVRYNIT